VTLDEPTDDPVDRYLQLGLALGRHLEGLVDAYYGPPTLAEVAGRGAPRDLRALGADASQLIADLDAGGGPGAGGDALHPVRRRWLRAQVVGLRTTALRLAGDPIGYVEEVERCYGVRPTWMEHDELAAAHAALDAVLPGGGAVAERLDQFRRSHLMTPDQLRAAVPALTELLRDRTASLFGLPDGEEVVFELVTDQPWSGFNYYEGGLRSRVAINVDLPVSSTTVAHLVAHEAYPGHHTEHCRKEVGLVRHRQQLEESIFLVGTPQCLVAEGLADLALEIVLGASMHETVAEVLHPLGIRYDVEQVAAVGAAAEPLAAVRGNAALLLHDRGASQDEAVAELVRWGLQPDDRATKAIAFLTHPTWRAYIFCYLEGVRRCRAFAAGDPARFDRLLAEQFVPDDLAAAG
jgi:hypothetical protein